MTDAEQRRALRERIAILRRRLDHRLFDARREAESWIDWKSHVARHPLAALRIAYTIGRWLAAKASGGR